MDGLAVPIHGFRILTGTANRPLAEEIARVLGVELCKTTVTRLADGEVFVRLDENVRGADIFIVQPDESAGREQARAAAADRRGATISIYDECDNIILRRTGLTKQQVKTIELIFATYALN